MRIQQFQRNLRVRVKRFHGAIQATLLLIAAAYWHVQISQGAYYRDLAENNRLRKLTIEAPRGSIVDRNGRSLAENTPGYSLFLDRALAGQDTVPFAAGVLGLPADELEQYLGAHQRVPKFRPIRIAKGLSLTDVARFEVEKYEHPEFEIEVEHQRLYRHAHQTAHILGYLGEVTGNELVRPGSVYRPGDVMGKKGLEGLYESMLRGQNGGRVVIVDSRGQLIEEFAYQQARPGRELTLTLDLDLQQEAARLLEDRVGAIVALDPRTGEVLALASSPSFDPNHFARGLRPEEWQALLEHPHHPLQNRAVQNTYPPGSVFKIVMALAGLDRGLLDPHATRAYCRGRSVIYNNVYRCWKASGHGWVDLRKAIKYSCNVYFHQLGQKIGIDQIAEYSRLFGLGSRTGIDLSGERAGLVPDSRWSQEVRSAPWYPGETISVATGQGPILVTPLQVAVAVAAVANGGRVVRPHLVRESDDDSVYTVRTLGLSPEHLALVREALWSVVNERDGTGASAAIEGLDVAGKTGTAQVIAQERRTDNSELAPEHRDHGWFASFAPADDAKLVVVVFVEHGGAGSRSAAPLARSVHEKFFGRG